MAYSHFVFIKKESTFQKIQALRIKSLWNEAFGKAEFVVFNFKQTQEVKQLVYFNAVSANFTLHEL